MKVGFSGTRNGLTVVQRDAFRTALYELRPRVTQFHHGACKGADAQAATLAQLMTPSPLVTAHPGKSAHDEEGDENPWLDKGSLAAADEVCSVKNHFARNRDIVNATDILFACPPCKPLPDSGGTAFTVTFARKVGKPLVIVYPDGSVEREGQ